MLLVVAHHTRDLVPGGYIGVDVFFVVSGFVITSMLRSQLRSTGSVSTRSFFGAFAQLAFVVDDTLLIDGARLPDEGAGSVTGDEALLASVSTGESTRIDPGVRGAAVESSSPGGSRLVYRTPAPGAELRVAVAGVHRSLGPSRPLRVEQDPVVLLTEEPADTSCCTASNRSLRTPVR